MPSPKTVHVVDTDTSVGKILRVLLARYDIDVRTYVDIGQFMESAMRNGVEPGCLLVDIDLFATSDLMMHLESRTGPSGISVILLVTGTDSNIRRQALHTGVTEVLQKSLIHGYLLDRTGQQASGLTPRQLELPDGASVTFRIMRPGDAAMEQAFVKGLSKRSRYLRFFAPIKELSPNMLKMLTEPNYPGSFALLATGVEDERERQIGVARYAPTDDEGVAEFAVAVADEWHGFGIATQLLAGITTAAAIAGFERLEAAVLRENRAMRELATTRGFKASSNTGDPGVVRVAKALSIPSQTEE